MTSITIGETKNRESLINVFVNDSAINKHYRNTSQSEQSSTDDVRTIESYSMSVLNSTTDLTGRDEENSDEWFAKMSNEEYLESIFGPALNMHNLSIMEKGKKIMHSSYLHIGVIVLILLDSLFIAIELLINAENCNNENETLELVSEVFKLLGLTILSIFMIELVFKIIFLNKEILKSKLEMFDAFVVIVSFILEVSFFDNHQLEAIGQITSLFRFWRIIRIANGKLIKNFYLNKFYINSILKV